MPLGTTNISISLVKNTLGDSAIDVGGLCKSQLINMFAKRKPVRDARLIVPIEEVGTSNNYGINVPIWNGTNQVWEYLKPRGGSTEPFRLADFAGYDHTAGIPIRLSTYTGTTHYVAYNSVLQITGISSAPNPSSPGLAWGDVLPNYYFAAELTNEENETVWGTSEFVETAGMSIDFSQAPFNTDNWRNSLITMKFFLSSVSKTFAETDKVSIKRALHYVAGLNETNQSITTVTEPYVDAEITGIRAFLNGGTWLSDDNVYDPQNPPPPLISSGGIALRVKFFNKAPNAIEINDNTYQFGCESNYHKVARYLNFTIPSIPNSNMYDIDAKPITGITVQPDSWSDEIILFDGEMLNWDGTQSIIPDPSVDKFISFKVFQKCLGNYELISTTFRKRCSSV